MIFTCSDIVISEDIIREIRKYTNIRAKRWNLQSYCEISRAKSFFDSNMIHDVKTSEKLEDLERSLGTLNLFEAEGKIYDPYMCIQREQEDRKENKSNSNRFE